MQGTCGVHGTGEAPCPEPNGDGEGLGSGGVPCVAPTGLQWRLLYRRWIIGYGIGQDLGGCVWPLTCNGFGESP